MQWGLGYLFKSWPGELRTAPDGVAGGGLAVNGQHPGSLWGERKTGPSQWRCERWLGRGWGVRAQTRTAQLAPQGILGLSQTTLLCSQRCSTDCWGKGEGRRGKGGKQFYPLPPGSHRSLGCLFHHCYSHCALSVGLPTRP